MSLLAVLSCTYPDAATCEAKVKLLDTAICKYRVLGECFFKADVGVYSKISGTFSNYSIGVYHNASCITAAVSVPGFSNFKCKSIEGVG